mmetsp:Transcript_41780/g.56951  ORF Transcript_41780/g.56951 Transcript_41780/m.56951 type:complete len:234 (-) Transcript_41780:734-1435(-)
MRFMCRFLNTHVERAHVDIPVGFFEVRPFHPKSAIRILRIFALCCLPTAQHLVRFRILVPQIGSVGPCTLPFVRVSPRIPALHHPELHVDSFTILLLPARVHTLDLEGAVCMLLDKPVIPRFLHLPRGSGYGGAHDVVSLIIHLQRVKHLFIAFRLCRFDPFHSSHILRVQLVRCSIDVDQLPITFFFRITAPCLLLLTPGEMNPRVGFEAIGKVEIISPNVLREGFLKKEDV